MAGETNIREMANLIANIKQDAEKLKELGKNSNIKCVEMNVVRMSAMIKMLELDITDAADILGA
ncbi:hypothetical protein [Desulfoscipio gibsoniae]|uniref:Uncharacterized protein n=1 Tax=Desulfoscipio gibsoniae DSM 7213 TaxID=767817 RepID=R4KNX2_9FIRM|nr:hypothetical protein [Desulfoscipio gibsoniae]AGL03262.1 hypothetical protein Desgi_3982 [Desulfoscipio gibsoniae DSM 7213]